MSDAPVIGFVGLGAMGGPIVEALQDAGHTLVVHDAVATSLEPAVARGATSCASPAEVADAADLVFVSLPRPEVVRAVALDPNGLREGTRMRTYVDLSTTGASVADEVARALSAQGVDVLDAPISGGVAGANARTLAVMAAGDGAVYERVRPLLALFGKHVVRVGDRPGQGQIAKLLNNLLSATALAITSEAMTLGVSAGLDPATLLGVFNAGTGRNTATSTKFPDQILTGRFGSGFRLELMSKDVDLCLTEARAHGLELEVAELVRALWAQAAAEEGTAADHTEIVKLFERRAGIEIGSV